MIVWRFILSNYCGFNAALGLVEIIDPNKEVMRNARERINATR